ncbi:type II toxin-antitoxin system prevent-host-death family antitoxin [bacterium]|nr:type II toxin-antitoxin system prevent-host-death family antitoxin [bacterium]
MNAITINQAKQRLDTLMEQVISDVEPTIICSDKGEKAVLISLDEFNSWQETLNTMKKTDAEEELTEYEDVNDFYREMDIIKDNKLIVERTGSHPDLFG